MATSGTVNTTPYDQMRVIEHAIRRAGKLPENSGAELYQTFSESLFTLLAQYVNVGYPLWTRQFTLTSGQIGNPDILAPAGTVDLMHAYWRVLNPWRGAATLTTGGDASVLFGAQANPDVTIAGPNPGVIANIGSSPGTGNVGTNGAEIDTVGVLQGGAVPITTTLQVFTSPDGLTWTLALTLPSATYTPRAWTYFDLKPTVITPFIKIQMPIVGSWAVNQLNLGLANGQDIELGPLNIDDYYNLPDKMFQSDRPNSLYWDRLGDAPQAKIWPTMNQGAFYNGCVSMLTRRYIEDPGLLSNNVEVPSRWLEMIEWRLANIILHEWPDDTGAGGNYFTLMARQQRMQIVGAEAQKAEALAWGEERTNSPRRLTPNISPYTR